MNDQASKPRILAVDDSRVMRRAMSKILSTEYEVIEAENGEDAWTYLLNNPDIQIVFTDLSMPYLDGFGLLERMRSADNEHIQDIPVIIITGKDDDDDTKQEALDKGANDFITKPFDSIQLQARAKAHLTFKQTTVKLNETSDKLERQATVDEITGLGGQRYFLKVGEETLSYIKRHGGELIMLRMDIDDFNTLFIKNGKQVADHILKQVGEKLAQLVRQEDTIARIGLSKFGMLLKATTLTDAMTLAERVKNEIGSMSFTANSHKLKLTVSIGLYEPKVNADDEIKDIIRETEKYLARAYDAGGNQIVSHSDSPGKPAAKPLPLTELAQFLETLNNKTPEQLLPHVDAIIKLISPLLKFLAIHAREKLQTMLKELGKK